MTGRAPQMRGRLFLKKLRDQGIFFRSFVANHKHFTYLYLINMKQ